MYTAIGQIPTTCSEASEICKQQGTELSFCHPPPTAFPAPVAYGCKAVAGWAAAVGQAACAAAGGQWVEGQCLYAPAPPVAPAPPPGPEPPAAPAPPPPVAVAETETPAWLWPAVFIGVAGAVVIARFAVKKQE